MSLRMCLEFYRISPVVVSSLAEVSGYLLRSFCPHISQHLFQACGYPKEEPVPAAVWEGEEGEEKEPCVLVSVTV